MSTRAANGLLQKLTYVPMIPVTRNLMSAIFTPDFWKTYHAGDTQTHKACRAVDLLPNRGE